MRHALVYVLMNARKHGRPDTTVDPCSSAPWFSGWRTPLAPIAALGRRPVVLARSWLARVGWRRHGLIGFDERPRAHRG